MQHSKRAKLDENRRVRVIAMICRHLGHDAPNLGHRRIGGKFCIGNHLPKILRATPSKPNRSNYLVKFMIWYMSVLTDRRTDRP